MPALPVHRSRPPGSVTGASAWHVGGGDGAFPHGGGQQARGRRGGPRPTLSYVLFIVFLLWANAAAAQPAAIVVKTETMDLAGFETTIDVYQPSVGPSSGLAIIAHGFLRSRGRHRDLGRALAEAGITAVIPDLPFTIDHWGNGDAIVELAGKLQAGALGLAPVERSRLVLIGTSAGGFATVLAAAELPGVAGWIGLDPVDRSGSGVEAAGRLTVPAVVLLGERSGCNLYGSGRAIGRAVPGLLRMTVLEGASHCDFEAPTNNFCRVICGKSQPGIAAVARGETVRAAMELLDAARVPRASAWIEPAD
jgi:pimeloyl-ACP methyl ester carboxylesterase